jgi:hypothetical protein
MPSDRSSTDPLRKLLDEAQTELHRRLQDACVAESRGVADDSTAEIRRLEDTLLAAAMAAERTIAARRHLQDAAVDAVRVAQSKARSAESEHTTTVREFEDETGRQWRAWPVIPDARRHQQGSLRGLGEYQEGWVCFEALDSSGRRRLPGYGRRWSDVRPDELPRLLAEAIHVPARKRH